MKNELNNISHEHTIKVDYVSGMLDISQGRQVDLCLQGDSLIIQSEPRTYRIPINKILGISMEEEKNLIKVQKSSIKRAFVGGLLACWLYPPVGIFVGSIIGAISGIGYSEKIQNNCILRIIFSDKDLNDKELIFSPPYMLFKDSIDKFVKELHSKIPQDNVSNLNGGAIIEL